MSYKQNLNKNIPLFYIIAFLTGLIFDIPTWVAFETRFLSFSEMALLRSYSFTLPILMELPTGALADLIGRRRTLLLGWLISAVGRVCYAFSGSLFTFFSSVSLIALGETLVSGADTALYFDTFKELKRGGDFSDFMAKGGFIYRIALAVATFCGGFLFLIDVKLPNLAIALTQILAAILIFQATEPKIDSEKFSINSYKEQTKLGFKELFKSNYTKNLTIFYALVGGITWSCMTFFDKPLAKEVGFSEVQMSLIFGAIYLASSFVIMLIGKFDKVFNKNTILLGFPVLMTFSLLPGIFANKAIAVALSFGVQVAGCARFTFLSEYVNERFESKYRATAVSALNMLVSICCIITILIGGQIQEVASTKLIFTLLGIVTLISVLPISVLLREKACKGENQDLISPDT